MFFCNNHLIQRIFLSLFVLLLLFLSGCASIGTPGGGLYDETPPRLVDTKPFEGSVGVKTQKIVMRFNENIKLDNANEKLTVSPPQVKSPTILSNAKTLSIELGDTLLPNTTYTIDLGDAVQDNNEGNPLEGLMLSFSTGDHIDSLRILGTLLEASNLEPVSGAFVGIYQADNAYFGAHLDSVLAIYPDSLLCLVPFERAGKTDAYGRFTISGVAPGRYHVFALKDGNTNYRYDDNNEQIAFLDSLVTPSLGHHTAYDTMFSPFDSTVVKDITTHIANDYYPHNLCLKLFSEGHANKYLDNCEWRDSTRLQMRFASAMPSLPTLSLVGDARHDWYVVEPNATYDTLSYWIADTAVMNRDTLKVALTYLFTKNGVDSLQTDTLHFEHPQAPVAKKEDTKKKRHKKGIDEPEVVEMKPQTVFMSVKMLGGSTINVGARPQFEVSAPLSLFNETGLHLLQQRDSLWDEMACEVVRDTLSPRLFRLDAKPHYSPGGSYQLWVDSAAMVDVWGHPVNATKITFQEKKTEDYAHLVLNIMGVKSHAFVQLVDEKDNPKYQSTVRNGQARFANVAAGKYYARLVEDRNNNGKWDTGALVKRQQPEQVYYFSTLLELRENWQFSQTWNIEALAPERQKPQALWQNKPKEKQKKQSKNEAYLRDHSRSKKK